MTKQLAVLLILSSFGSAALGQTKQEDASQRAAAAAAAITKLGGKVVKDMDAPGQPVVKVSLPACTCLPDDSHLVHLESLPELRRLELRNDCKSSHLTDKGLVHVRKLAKLEHLNLGDSGGGPGVTDKGLAQLEGLTNLKELALGSHRGVTDAGLTKLQKALPNLRITRTR